MPYIILPHFPNSTRARSWVTYSYEPLAHSQRGNDLRAIRYGARVGLLGVRRLYPIRFRLTANLGLLSQDREVSAMFDDLKLLKPTSISAVPRYVPLTVFFSG